jgi:tetratricopeptide (TPR) repeat protein
MSRARLKLTLLMPSKIDAAIQLAVRHFQAGRWAEGAAVCREILAVEPGHAAALHLMGLAEGNAGNLNDAIELVRKAIASNPYVPEYHSNLSKLLYDQSRIGESIAEARAAIQLLPGISAAWVNLGRGLHRNGKLSEAASAFVEAARLEPGVPEFQRLAGNELLSAGQMQRAVQYFRRLAQISEAEQNGGAHYDLGVALAANMQWDEAIAAYRQAVELNPSDERAWNNLGNTYKRAGRLTEAVDALREAIRLKPDWGEAHCNLGGALVSQGEIESAAEVFGVALEKSPEHPVIHYNHGVLLLLRGDYERGWSEYEWRWKCSEVHVPTRIDSPAWRGEPLEGKRILLHAEQGLGDTIQFSRYVPMVAERGGAVFLCVQPETVRLLGNLRGVRQVGDNPKQLPACEAYCYLMDLPLAFGTRVESIPRTSPYLYPDPNLREKWGRKLPMGTDLKVGLAWAGRPTHASDLLRSMKLSQFAPLSKVAGVAFYSLQKGAGSEQAIAPPVGMNWIDLVAEIKDLADTAALISHLDLVITVDSAVAHLAGAMGKPVWILTRFAPDWRWMLKREDSPWYPTARLFRQTVPGEWGTVVERVCRELEGVKKSG